jgi:methylmalonyl-CoA/ethylmalonyl-CoA epimerase
VPVRVDHFSIAVRSIERALDRFSSFLPVRIRRETCPGYTDDFRWCDFYVAGVKIELIESARPGSFVERFLERRGEGIHHLSIEVDALDPIVERMRRDGVRIVDEFDAGDGEKTAFVSPRSAHGMLIQFWQVNDPTAPSADEAPMTALLPGLGSRMRFDHLSSAVSDIPQAFALLRRYLPITGEAPLHRGYAGDFDLKQFDVGDVGRFRMELIADASGASFIVPFLAKRGEGFHHVSIDVEEIDPLLVRLRAAGVRVVDEADIGGGYKTAFVSPRSAHGVLIQFWQVPDLDRPNW